MGEKAGGEFTQDGIDEGSGGALAGTLDELNALVDGGTGGYAAEPTELIYREAEGGENLRIEFGEWLRRARGNL